WPPPQHQAPAWAIAQYSGDALVVWTCTRHSDALRYELSRLCSLPQEAVRIIANGQVDTEGYDVAADAALLSRSCGRPVRVQQDPDALNAQPRSVSVSGTPASRDSAGGSGSPLPVSGLIVSSDLHPGRRPSIAALLCGFEIQHPPEHVVRMIDYAPQAC